MNSSVLKISLLVLLFSVSMFGQSKFNRFLKPSDTLNVQRRNAVIITEASVVTLGLIGLNELWYKDFPRSEFQTIDDSAEWRKVDKIGHVFSSYQLTRLGSESLGWSGANKRSQMIFGSAMSLGFLTTIEIFDGFSEEWGFSWSDFGANVLGSALFVGQDLAWSEQRMLVKFSFNRTDFPALNPDKLGENLVQEIFKDYNGQTYWLSFNLQSFFKESGIPPWLNLAVGYGAEGMLTGVANDPDGIFTDQDRYSQWYLSLDIDLSKIRTESHVLRTVFSLLNVVKIPLPTVEFSSRKKRIFYLFH